MLQKALMDLISGACRVSLPPVIELWFGRLRLPTAADFNAQGLFLWYLANFSRLFYVHPFRAEHFTNTSSTYISFTRTHTRTRTSSTSHIFYTRIFYQPPFNAKLFPPHTSLSHAAFWHTTLSYTTLSVTHTHNSFTTTHTHTQLYHTHTHTSFAHNFDTLVCHTTLSHTTF